MEFTQRKNIAMLNKISPIINNFLLVVNKKELSVKKN